MTEKKLAAWMVTADKELRKNDWGYYFDRGMMELLTPLLKAQIGSDFTAYVKVEKEYIRLCNWTAYEEGRRLGEDIVEGRLTASPETAEDTLQCIMVDASVPAELPALRERVQNKAQGVYFKVYQEVAAEARKIQEIRAGLRGMQDGGMDMGEIGDVFGLR